MKHNGVLLFDETSLRKAIAVSKKNLTHWHSGLRYRWAARFRYE